MRFAAAYACACFTACWQLAAAANLEAMATMLQAPCSMLHAPGSRLVVRKAQTAPPPSSPSPSSPSRHDLSGSPCSSSLVSRLVNPFHRLPVPHGVFCSQGRARSCTVYVPVKAWVPPYLDYPLSTDHPPSPTRYPLPATTTTATATATATTYHTPFRFLHRLHLRKELAVPVAAYTSVTMPRVTISITAPEQSADSDILSMELPSSLTIEDLKGLIEAEKGHPTSSQNLYLNGQPLNSPTQTLEDAGIHDGEMLAVNIRRRGNPTQRQPRREQPARPGAPDPEDVRQRLLRNPNGLQEVRGKHPALVAAINDPASFRQIYFGIMDEQGEQQRERQRQLELLNDDPFNVDNQRKIEEIIRQEQVVNNLQKAMEDTPEVFGRVHMLYVNTEVNGVPVKAFVDSGAQATIMSPDCAERCGIMRLLDNRYGGIAKGVGTAKILGRVHSAEIQIGGFLMKCAFTVMEGKDVELLFGLDMLKRYRAKIDLEKDALCFEGIEVPFLPESEIPKSFEDEEPTVEGPNGTQIGAKTGAVKEASGSSSRVAVGPPPQAAPVPAPPPAPVTAQPESSSASQYPQRDIDALLNLGFSHEDAIQALRATQGNVDFAASLLFSRQ